MRRSKWLDIEVGLAVLKEQDTETIRPLITSKSFMNNWKIRGKPESSISNRYAKLLLKYFPKELQNIK